MSAVYVQIKRVLFFYAGKLLNIPAWLCTPVDYTFLFSSNGVAFVLLELMKARAGKKSITIFYKNIIHFYLVTPNTVVL